MATILTSLDTIANVYSIFEKDQVLTDKQLNDVTNYLDDQNRLTRINLNGVGIVCGMRVELANNEIRVEKGVGVTTDGDLIYFANDKLYDRYKLYDDTNPVYAPFYVNNTLLTIFELIEKGAQDAHAKPLSQFAGQTGQSFNNTAVLAFMQSYAKDNDICSGTDCDNLGKDCINNLKILLLSKSALATLKDNLQVPAQAYPKLEIIAVDRPVIASNVDTLAELAKPYRDACAAIHAKLIKQFAALYASCKFFLSDIFPTDPAPAWQKSLETLKDTTFVTSNFGIQYYYDFLKDVAETYHSFHELLFNDQSICCPPTSAFAKHLLLGNLITTADADENRTAFYPSPLIRIGAGQRKHARFLLKKLDVLVKSFKLPDFSSAVVTVTPSSCEGITLEERAIPYYVAISNSNPLHEAWNFQRQQRGLSRYNYSYHALQYQAEGAAANPLGAQLGQYNFFRIEGHLGKNVNDVISVLETAIKTKNLPFGLIAVALTPDKTKVTVKPWYRYTDLHRFHYLLRQDLAYQLDDVKLFSGKFKEQVDKAVADNVVTNSPPYNGGLPVKGIAEQKNTMIQTKSLAAKNTLDKKYSAYKQDASWKSNINQTVLAAGEFKQNLGSIVKTEFNTPFDILIGSSQSKWLDWLDVLIKDREEKQDEKLMFSKFIVEHPQIEHFAGVPRGGTFILVYDGNNKVMADFMLPYYCCEHGEDEPDEPTLPKPPVKPGWVVDNGIKVIPLVDKIIDTKIIDFKVNLDKELLPKFSFQNDYFNVVKDSINLMGTVFGGGKTVDLGTVGIGGKFTDKELGFAIDDVAMGKAKVSYFKEQFKQPGLSPTIKNSIELKLNEAEAELAKSIEKVGKNIASKSTDVKIGTEEYNAVLTMAAGVNEISNTLVLNNLKTIVTAGVNDTQQPNLGGMYNMIFNK